MFEVWFFVFAPAKRFEELFELELGVCTEKDRFWGLHICAEMTGGKESTMLVDAQNT